MSGLEWVKGQGGKAVTKAEIMAGLNTKYVGNTLKKMVEKAKTLTVKDGKYSVVPA